MDLWMLIKMAHIVINLTPIIMARIVSPTWSAMVMAVQQLGLSH